MSVYRTEELPQIINSMAEFLLVLLIIPNSLFSCSQTQSCPSPRKAPLAHSYRLQIGIVCQQFSLEMSVLNWNIPVFKKIIVTSTNSSSKDEIKRQASRSHYVRWEGIIKQETLWGILELSLDSGKLQRQQRLQRHRNM